ncbi:hypothetical protein GJ744_000145 [Endocarpon pusillum]|uniref:Uncharacterized protein n=1 Tax=Endocarpon pusillum TaxID=364733 RepID=A0A8H7EAA4_9EURO|nr:hypothetical protein GJ744_000145 [Endocarpon pusillum]
MKKGCTFLSKGQETLPVEKKNIHEEAAPASSPSKEASALEEAAPVSVPPKEAPQKGPGGKWLQESLFYKRMGHLNREYVRMLPKSARSEFQVRFEKKQGACETCILAKQKRRLNREAAERPEQGQRQGQRQERIQRIEKIERRRERADIGRIAMRIARIDGEDRRRGASARSICRRYVEGLALLALSDFAVFNNACSTPPSSRPRPEIDKLNQYPALVSWDRAEKPLIDFAEADVLTIFDCCHAGQEASRIVNWHRIYETLSATDERGVTPTPGPKSFTSALISSLIELRDGPLDAFSTADLLESMSRKLPSDYGPILNNRSSNLSSRHLVLEPHRFEDKNDVVKPPKASWGLIFDINSDRLAPAQARHIANALPRVFQNAGGQLHDIRWQNFTPYAPAEESPSSPLT